MEKQILSKNLFGDSGMSYMKNMEGIWVTQCPWWTLKGFGTFHTKFYLQVVKLDWKLVKE